jgi:hypothetical protein
MRSVVILLANLALPVVAHAQSTGFYLPNATPSYGQDEFRASDGTSCRSTMEAGTFATGGNQSGGGSNYGLPGYVSNPTQGNIGVYGRFTWSLDAKPNRMDCTKLYELEIEKKQLELELLRQQVQVARQGMRDADQQLSEAKKKPTPQRRTALAGPPP